MEPLNTKFWQIWNILELQK